MTDPSPESYCSKLKRLHPWWFRYMHLKDKLEYAWLWIVDGPVWDLEDPDNPKLQGYRTGRPMGECRCDDCQ